MALLTPSKKAEQFAQLLDGNGGQTASSELAKLEGLVSRLSAVPQPRAAFTSALRDQLLREAATSLPGAAGLGSSGLGSSGPAGPPGAGGTGSGGTAGLGGNGLGGGTSAFTSSGGASAAPGLGSSLSSSISSAASSASSAVSSASSTVSGVLAHTVPLWAQVVAGAAAATIAVTGVGLGASRALPGDPLYGVKRQVEVLQLDLAGGSADEARTKLGFASARLTEIDGLLAREATPGQPLSAEVQGRIRQLMEDWASDTSGGTTTLLSELRAAQGNLPAVRTELVGFTRGSAQQLAEMVQNLPDSTLQSLAGSAFAYLQRLDIALGSPVGIAQLLPTLGLPLPTTPRSGSVGTGVTPSTKPTTPGGTGTSGTSGSTQGGSSGTSSVPTLPIPNGSAPDTSGTTSKLPVPTIPNLPTGKGSSGGGVGAVTGSANGVSNTVNGVLNGVTGRGPSLPLPTAVPNLPTGR